MSEGLVEYTVVRRLQAQVADRLATDQREADSGAGASLTKLDEQQQALSYIAEAVSGFMAAELSAGRELPDESFDQRLRDAVFAAIYGAGELQELLDDDRIENIDCNGFDQVFVSYAGQAKPMLVAPFCGSDDELIAIVATLAEYAGINARPWNSQHPELDLRLPDGSRLSGLMGATERPCVSIRRSRLGSRIQLKDLVANGTLNAQCAAFLRACVQAKLNIVVAGATDAGKTTLLRALINCVPPHERLITVERALELGLSRHPDLHPNVCEWEERLHDGDGQNGITVADLVVRTRRFHPDRVIVGETLGLETPAMLAAMSQGNEGSFTSLHARNVKQVIRKLAEYTTANSEMNSATAMDLIGDAVDIIIYLRKNPDADNQRCITDVIEVTPGEEGKVNTLDVFLPTGPNGEAERVAQPAFEFQEELRRAGYDDGSYGAPLPYGEGDR